jgi:hypothetical protein
VTTINVPSTTISVGSRSFTGPVDDASNHIAITIDRTPAGGLNSLTSASQLSIGVTASYDGGVTFGNVGFGGPWPGGTELDKHGVQRTFDFMSTTLEPGTGRIARLTITVAGPSSIVAGGSIATS